MTIGDVLAAIAAICVLGTTWGATLLLVALAAPLRAERAQAMLQSSPGACLARGFAVALLSVVVAAALGRQAAGPMRLLSGLVWAALGALAALGGAGIARLIGERIQSTGTQMSPFASLTRGTIVYVAAGFLPGVGWLLIAPVAVLLSLGSGVAVMVRPQAARAKTETVSVLTSTNAEVTA